MITLNNIQVVGIVGAGTMGQGIAQVCSSAGFTVLLYDKKPDLIQNGISRIEKNLQKGIEKNKITTDQKQRIQENIKACNDIKDLKADLIIEAAIEKLSVKTEIFIALEKVNSVDCILASNTSSIPITQIGAALKNQERFAGIHFFNPAHIMKLVEVISGVNTSSVTLNVLKEFSEKLDKTPVMVKDSPGFIVNRVARHFYVEALQLLEENVGDVETIDTLMRSSGFKMGPFELMDLIGVDTNFSVTNSMYQGFHQSAKFRPSRIQQQKVNAGHFGRKSGKGFYDYDT